MARGAGNPDNVSSLGGTHSVQVIVFLNLKDELRVLDPFSLEEVMHHIIISSVLAQYGSLVGCVQVESVNIKSTGLVYHTEFITKTPENENGAHELGKVSSHLLHIGWCLTKSLAHRPSLWGTRGWHITTV